MTDKTCYLHGLIGVEVEVWDSGICQECYYWAEDKFPPDVDEKELREAFILTNTSTAAEPFNKEHARKIARELSDMQVQKHEAAECEHPSDSVEDGFCYKCSENIPGYEPNQTFVRTILTDLGWHYEPQTGGNCTAYSKPTHDPEHNGAKEGWYWLLTDAMDPVAPTRAKQKVTLGLYNDEGMPVVSFTVRLSLILYGDLVVEDTYA